MLQDRDQEIERLVALEARRVDIGQTGAESWTVLADPRRAAWVRAAALRLACGCEGSSSYPLRAAGSGRNLGSGKASSG